MLKVMTKVAVTMFMNAEEAKCCNTLLKPYGSNMTLLQALTKEVAFATNRKAR